MLQIVSPDINVDFIGKRKIWVGISLIALIASVVLLFTKGINYGIDFTGGAVVQVQFQNSTETSQVRKLMSDGGLPISVIQQVGGAEANEFQLKVQADAENLQEVAGSVEGVLTKAIGADGYSIRKVDVVGPRAGAALRESSFWAALYAIMGILIYIAIRFDFRYSPGAIMALIHDTTLILGVFVLTAHEFNLSVVAALLTIIGYSINDTIIVYDRIRETIKANPKRDLATNVNASINSTLGRTIITSITTLLAVSALWILGGGIIREFAEALFVGIVVGTYSSIFIASPIFLFTAERQERAAAARKAAPATQQRAAART